MHRKIWNSDSSTSQGNNKKAKLAEVILKVIVGGYYSCLKWLNKEDDSQKIKIKVIVRKILLENNCVYSSWKIKEVISLDCGIAANHKKFFAIMLKENIISKIWK